MAQPSQQRVVWIGPTSGDLGWLRDRLVRYVEQSTVRSLTQLSVIEPAELQTLISTGVERLIFACPNRLDYPRQNVELMEKFCPEVPLAVAIDSWWDGAMRTGIGPTDHLTLPWYRWWDGWIDWLDGRRPQLFGPCQTPYAFSYDDAVARPTRFDSSHNYSADGNPKNQTRGLIVGNCRQTTEAWQLVADSLGHQAEVVLTHEFYGRTPSQTVQWVLWDDTSLDTRPSGAQQTTPDQALPDFFAKLSRTHPAALGIAALNMPRSAPWHPFLRHPDPSQTAPALQKYEFFAKPSSGLALRRILENRTFLAR